MAATRLGSPPPPRPSLFSPVLSAQIPMSRARILANRTAKRAPLRCLWRSGRKIQNAQTCNCQRDSGARAFTAPPPTFARARALLGSLYRRPLLLHPLPPTLSPAPARRRRRKLGSRLCSSLLFSFPAAAAVLSFSFPSLMRVSYMAALFLADMSGQKRSARLPQRVNRSC